MSINKHLPAVAAWPGSKGRPDGVRHNLCPRALARWDSSIRAAAVEDKDDRSISVLDVIGEDFWTGEGVTAKRVAGALRSLGKGPVRVDVNSPGGNMFEGLAIYNMLREHDGEVTVRVLGLAASAASLVAMAGDQVLMARAAFLMIHNAWIVALGNQNDLRAAADWLEPFDGAMADIYAARTGIELKHVQAQMDAETWISSSSAIEQGYADDLLPADKIEKTEAKASAAARRLEAALRGSGMPKNEALRLISEFRKTGSGDPVGSGSGDPAERGSGGAGEPAIASLSSAAAAALAVSLPVWRPQP